MSQIKGFVNDGADTDDHIGSSIKLDVLKSDNDNRGSLSRSFSLPNDSGLPGEDSTDRELDTNKSRRISVITIDEASDKKDDYQGDSIFSRRMTIAGGFLDIALFSSNCEQLKSLLEIGDEHDYYKISLSLLVISMFLQVAAGFTLFMVGCVTIKNPEDKRRSDIMNHVTFGLVALITIVNIFITSFNVKGDVLIRCFRGEFIRKAELP